MIKLGSLFAGIGGFELGAQWAFDRAGIPHGVLFQVEQNKYCQSILRKHWPGAQIFDDVRAVGRHNLPNVDILMGGFPCQDISVCGHQKGIINGKKSSLWFEMLRVIGELRPAIAVLENVPAIVRVGGPVVVGGLAEIGYDCEWQIVSARQFGAPHLRKRWFCIATDTESGQRRRVGCRQIYEESQKPSGQKSRHEPRHSGPQTVATDANRPNSQKQSMYTESTVRAVSNMSKFDCRQILGIKNAWQKGAPVSPLCSVDDGIPDRMARLKALGNAIVPQCSEYIFEHIIKNIIQND